jgi:hypothetical protein
VGSSFTVARLLTAMDRYRVAWILGNYQAARLPQLSAGADGLAVRLGLRWSKRTPSDPIATIVPAPTPLAAQRVSGYLQAVLMVPPQPIHNNSTVFGGCARGLTV